MIIKSVKNVEEDNMALLTRKIYKCYSNLKSRMVRLECANMYHPMFCIYYINASKELCDKLHISDTYIKKWRKASLWVQHKISLEQGIYFLYFNSNWKAKLTSIYFFYYLN
jgi:hypothetical protein